MNTRMESCPQTRYTPPPGKLGVTRTGLIACRSRKSRSRSAISPLDRPCVVMAILRTVSVLLAHPGAGLVGACQPVAQHVERDLGLAIEVFVVRLDHFPARALFGRQRLNRSTILVLRG